MKKHISVWLKIVAFFGCWAAVTAVVEIPSAIPAWWRFFAELVPMGAAVILTVIFTSGKKNSVKIPLAPRSLDGLKTGGALGIIWFGVSELVLFAVGLFNIIDSNEVPMLWLWMAAAFCNVVMQELLVRGYIYQQLKAQYGRIASAVLTSALFLFMHAGALEYGAFAVLNIISMSILMTLLMEFSGSIAAPIAAHSIWNILGGTVFGCVNLAEDYPSLLQTHLFGDNVITGGKAGIEGSIIVFLLNLSLIAALALYRRLYKKDTRLEYPSGYFLHIMAIPA